MAAEASPPSLTERSTANGILFAAATWPIAPPSISPQIAPKPEAISAFNSGEAIKVSPLATVPR